jgi:hypothetical protein
MVKSDNTPNVDKLAEMPENVPVPAKPLWEKERLAMMEYYEKMEDKSYDFEWNELMENLNKQVNVYKLLMIWIVWILIICMLAWYYFGVWILEQLWK